jgi:polyferredoxin
MIKQLPLRQRVRKAIIILVFLSFPITMNFLSPYVIIDGAMNGIVNGSLVMFGLMFLASLFLGRAWCGWVCPGAGMQEIIEPINVKPVNGKKIDWIKWVIWAPWVSLIIYLAIQAGGYRSTNLLYHTQGGISVAGSEDRPIFFAYLIYYTVIFLFIGLALFAGRRAGCHTICWMAPFMILGRKLRNLFHWPSLRLVADADRCRNCKKCTRECQMSLDVNALVHSASMEHSECVLCGTCIDGCPEKVIRFTFSPGK